MLLAVTASAETLLRSVVMSSVMPSLKYSCSASPLMLVKGSTQTENFGLGFSGAGAAGGASCAACACARAIMVASAFRHSCIDALSAFPPQSSRSVVWIARTSIGRRACSKRTGTSIPRSAASRASPRTQRDATEIGVHTTSTALAASISASIWSSNSCPGVISGSHQTDQPLASIAATRGATRALSARA